jgi:mannose/fructose/N-acetylgalactosamine-specific phosphotransferase system component IIB
VIAFVRIDNRLIHGQVVEGWLPVLKVDRLVVLDDGCAASSLTCAAMGLAVPSPISVEILPLSTADLRKIQARPEPTLVLLKEVSSASMAKERGLMLPTLNLGNVHFAPGRFQVGPSVFLSLEEVAALRALSRAGTKVELRSLPNDRPLGMDEIAARVEGASKK